MTANIQHKQQLCAYVDNDNNNNDKIPTTTTNIFLSKQLQQ